MRTPGTRGRRKPIEIAMTPMIDVVFLLLIFFLTTSSFERIERSMPAGISPEDPLEAKGQAGSLAEWLEQVAAEDEQIVIEVSARGETYAINGTAVEGIDDLRRRLEALARARSGLPVIVDPQADVPLGAAMQVYDLAVGAGSANVFFAAE